MKPRSPIVSALRVLGYTFGGFFGVFIAGNILVALVFGAESEMNWPFSFLLLLLSPFVFIGGIAVALGTFERERARQKGEKVDA